MDYADAIRRQAEDAPRAALPAVTAMLWRAYGEGKVTEAEAESLSALIEIRRALSGSRPLAQIPNPTGTGGREGTADPQTLVQAARRAIGSRPRTDASVERRRRWAASGRLPPQLAARFTLAEQAVLSVIAAEVVKRGDCRLHLDHLAALAGVGRTTAKNALREARGLGLLTVEERRITGFRNDSNVVRIVSPEWIAWNRLVRRETRPSDEGGGVKTVTGTTTRVLESGKTRPAEPSKGCRRAAGDPNRSDPARIRAGGRTGRAMR